MVGATPAPGATRKTLLRPAAIAGALAFAIALGGCGDRGSSGGDSSASAVVASRTPAPAKPGAIGSAGSDRAPGPAAAGAASSTGIPACDEYVKAFDGYLACDKVSQATKEASRQAVEAQKAGWAHLAGAPAEAKKAAADACKDALATLVASARALGCPR